jgi:histone-lysine N-methyltransferase SETD1
MSRAAKDKLSFPLRNTATASDRKASQSRSSAFSLTAGAKSLSKGRVDGNPFADDTRSSQRTTPHDEDELHRVSPSDVLNTVGSASSLSSTASSVFSNTIASHAPDGALSNMSALTPLTNAESSPSNSKMLSPQSTKRTYDEMRNGDTASPYLAAAADSRAASRTITPVQTPPEKHLQARPGPGEVKGLKITLDPILDHKVSSKERKTLKPTYREFGAEVRSTSMRVYLLT